MQETVRLFDMDSHETEFEACVLSCEEDNGLYRTVLDRTLFFPEEGGQTCDRGTINNIEVVKVLEEDRVIYHWLKEPLWEGDTVTGVIDWDKRFSDMQQHSGEHIVSGLMHKYFKFDNVGFHLGSEFVTMDFNGVISEDQLRMIEYKANEAVAKDIEIKISWPSEEELAQMSYRSKKALEGPVRIVEIPGYDVCACCAPHVYRTGEIGIIRLVNMMHYKGGIRVEMLCGFRALADALVKEKNIYSVSSMLSVKPEETSEAVRRLKDENGALKQERNDLKWSALESRIEQIPADSGNVCLFDEFMDRGNMRRAYNALVKRCSGLCACFVGDDENGYRYVSGGRNVDAAAQGKAMNEALNGHGGGSGEMFQGSLSCSREEITEYFENMKN